MVKTSGYVPIVLWKKEVCLATIVTLVKNVQDGAELMANTDSFTIDADVAKIRVPYAMYDATTQD